MLSVKSRIVSTPEILWLDMSLCKFRGLCCAGEESLRAESDFVPYMERFHMASRQPYCSSNAIGHCRKARGLGESMVMLTYSNQLN